MGTSPFKVHKGGKFPGERKGAWVNPEDERKRRLWVEGPAGKVWCYVVCDKGPMESIFPKVVEDHGVWLQPAGKEAFLVGKGRGPGYVVKIVSESRPLDRIGFVLAYLEFFYEQLDLGKAEKWRGE